MRPRQRIGACSLLLAGVASAPAVFAAGFDVTAQDRSVELAIRVTTLQCAPPPSGCSVVGTPTDHSDSESAPDLSPFAATASVPAFGGFSASQDSSLSATSIHAQGSGLHTGSGQYTQPETGMAEVTSGSSDSHFEVSFDVDAPTPYRLRGSVSANGGLSANSTARIRLRNAGGATLAEVVAATDPDCQMPECAAVGPLPLDQLDVLAPGAYVLEASTAGSAEPFFFALNFLTLASTGAYELELTLVDVPALGPGALALLALALAAAPFLARLR